MRQTKLILISGPPGAGKSTLAKELAKRLSLVILDKDCIDEPFSPNDRGELYTREIEPKVLASLFNLTKLNLEVGRDVLLDLPWTHILIDSPEWKLKLQRLQEATQSSIRVIELGLSEACLRERLTKRGLQRDESKLTDSGWKDFIERDKLSSRIPLDHLYVEVEEALAEYLPKVVKYLTD